MATLAIVIALPAFVYPTWNFLMYSAIFGVAGAYLRYRLSLYNPTFKEFPIGTFTANIFGTYVLAVLTLLSKFVVSYSDHQTMAVIFGLAYGFCGNLTTISTFVNELNTLPRKAGYAYGLVSTIVA